MATNWLSFNFQIPGQDILASVKNILEVLLVFLEILKAILQIIQVFLLDFGNPIKALVEALIKLILELFDSLKKSGFYGYFDVPDPSKDPNFFRQLGGYQAFLTRFKGSVLDARDPSRPQPTPGFSESGFIMFVVDADNIQTLLKLINALLNFFGKDLISPQYGPPANVKVLPIGDSGDPILAVAKVFSSQPKALAVEWSLPTNQQPPDPGFSDLASMVGQEFVPPKFLIEKSSRSLNEEVDAGSLGDASAVGTVVVEQETNFELRGKPGKRIKRKVKAVDDYGDLFIKFEKYIVVSTSSNTGTFFLGQLGKFRYIDKDVDFDKTYFYRVRAFSGDLTVSNGNISFKAPKAVEVNGQNTGQMVVKWPGKAVIGKSSGVVRARLVKFPPNFDIIGDLKMLFQTAFSLNFHLEKPGDVQFDGGGNPIPANRTDVIGRGLLVRQASLLAGLESLPFLGSFAKNALRPGEFTGVNPVDGSPVQQPWQTTSVRRASARLANDVASALLESGSSLIEQFRALMQGGPPAGQINIDGFDGANTLEKMVQQFTGVPEDGIVLADGAVRYANAYADPTFRRNIAAAINFVTSFTLGGVPPDWVRISLLRDIIPWSASMLYDLIAKIQALVDAYRGVFDEIAAFITMLIRKIDVLERFIKYLISLLDFVLSLSIGAYILFLPVTSDGIAGWFEAIDTAGGSKPPSGPAGYTAGVAIAYTAPSVAGFAAPLKIIFGG